MDEEATPTTSPSPSAGELIEVMPKSGRVYSERGDLQEVLCKPKILPLKSHVLVQLRRLEEAADE